MSDPQQPTGQPLDLSAFAALATPDEAGNPASGSDSSGLPVETTAPTGITAPMPAFERLVELSTLPAELQARAHQLADSIRFEDTASTLTFIEHTLQPIAQVSRQLLADTTVGNAGEVGQIAAAVIDGIKILRIDELQAEAHKIAPKATGLLGRVMGLGKLAHDAAISVARSLQGDNRNLEALSALAEQTISTMQEVLKIEQDAADEDRKREQELVRVRDRLVSGMRGVQQAALARQVRGACRTRCTGPDFVRYRRGLAAPGRGRRRGLPVPVRAHC